MYWRLSSVYFCFFSSLGALLPYWSLYLNRVGFSPVEIGELMGLVMATKIVSPNVWAWLADHTGLRMTIVRWASLCAVVAFAGIFAVQGYVGYALVMLGFSFFWNAILPQFEATTLSYLGEHIHRYSRIRLWGSLGFIISSSSVGWALDIFGATLLPSILLVMLISIWLSSFGVQEPLAYHVEKKSGPILEILKQPQVLLLFLVCFLMQASHGPYYTFYTLYLEQYGYGRTLIGQLWALGVMAEVVLFLFLPRLISRFGLRPLLMFSLFLAAVRWLALGVFADRLFVVVMIQLLHAATFGIFHGVAIQYIHRLFTGTHQSRGQALYSSLSFGAGGAAGAFMSGYSWGHLGPAAMYLLAALLSVVALILSRRAAPA